MYGNLEQSGWEHGTAWLGIWDRFGIWDSMVGNLGQYGWQNHLVGSGTVQFTHMYSIFPRFFLADEQKRHFEKLSIYCNHYASLIPMSFVLGISIGLFTFLYTIEPYIVDMMQFVFLHIHVVNPRRFLRDRDSEPLVESVHVDPAAGPGDVRALGQCTGRGRAWKAAAAHTHALHQSVCSAHPALRQHRRL